MDGGRASASVEVALSIDFDVIGVGDFDGDGAAEVATRDPGGNVFVVRPLAAPPAFEATDLANTQGWTGMGAVDLELDRSDELVLVSAEAIRFAGLPGDQVVALDPDIALAARRSAAVGRVKPAIGKIAAGGRPRCPMIIPRDARVSCRSATSRTASASNGSTCSPTTA